MNSQTNISVKIVQSRIHQDSRMQYESRQPPMIHNPNDTYFENERGSIESYYQTNPPQIPQIITNVNTHKVIPLLHSVSSLVKGSRLGKINVADVLNQSQNQLDSYFISYGTQAKIAAKNRLQIERARPQTGLQTRKASAMIRNQQTSTTNSQYFSNQNLFSSQNKIALRQNSKRMFMDSQTRSQKFGQRSSIVGSDAATALENYRGGLAVENSNFMRRPTTAVMRGASAASSAVSGIRKRNQNINNSTNDVGFSKQKKAIATQRPRTAALNNSYLNAQVVTTDMYSVSSKNGPHRELSGIKTNTHDSKSYLFSKSFEKKGSSVQKMPQEIQNIVIPKNVEVEKEKSPEQHPDSAKFSRNGEISNPTKLLNISINQHFETLQKNQQLLDVGDKISKVDTSIKLQKVIKGLKTLRFNATNAVAREVDKVVKIETCSDASRGPIKTFDIIQDCQVTCKIAVKDRKGPFKIYIGYNDNGNKLNQQFLSSALIKNFIETAKSNLNIPDLKVFVSEQKNPGPENSTQFFVNPISKIWIRNKPVVVDQEDTKGSKGPQKDPSIFQMDDLYLTFHSVVGCTISVSAQFSAEEEKKHQGKNETRRKTNKQIRDEIQERVQEEIDAIIASNKPGALKEYNAMIKEKQEYLRRLNHVPCDTNFLEFNVDLAKNLEYYRYKQAQTRYLHSEKSHENAQRRLILEAEKLEYNKYILEKWDLFRKRRDIIGNQYIDKKRQQMQIDWWVRLIIIKRMIFLTSSKFDQNKAIKLLKIRKEACKRKIWFYYRQYLKKKVLDRQDRDANLMRQIFTSVVPTQMHQAEKWGKKVLKMVFQEEIEFGKIIKCFTDHKYAVEKIQKYVRFAWKKRVEKLADLNRFFESELRMLISYYTEKSRKNKKLKPTLQGFINLKPETKIIVLTHWYVHKMCANNLINAIYYHAWTECTQGKREDGRFTDREMQNINALYHNRKLATDFLVKGTKDIAPVGSLKADDATEEKKVNVGPQEDIGFKPLGGGLDFSKMFAAAPDNTKSKTGIATDIKEEVISKDEDRKKSKSKSTGKKDTKKGKKKKAAKEIPLYITSDEIPESTQGFNLYRPDRATMQRLVRRCADLKDCSKKADTLDLSLFQDVAPWCYPGEKRIKINDDLNESNNPTTDLELQRALEKEKRKSNQHWWIVCDQLKKVHEEMEK